VCSFFDFLFSLLEPAQLTSDGESLFDKRFSSF
jgi:hypothetical protein